jgi:hypothetical protein
MDSRMQSADRARRADPQRQDGAVFDQLRDHRAIVASYGGDATNAPSAPLSEVVEPKK